MPMQTDSPNPSISLSDAVPMDVDEMSDKLIESFQRILQISQPVSETSQKCLIPSGYKPRCCICFYAPATASVLFRVKYVFRSSGDNLQRKTQCLEERIQRCNGFRRK